ncbi:MAG: septation protein A [Gammaproteobacteria bacterium]|nr:septation protein A [Gammaproteobacteria bacterium]
MKLLFDFFPILIFFICFKLFGIYTATTVAIILSILQVLIYRIKYQRYEKLHVISLAMILVLGGATLFFHNPWFIKWKPTAIYWLSSILFLGSTYIGKKPIIQKIMENNIQLPKAIWKRLSLAWSGFFLLMGFANLYVAHHYNTNTWVNFKLFGGGGCTLLFVLLQALYLAKHAKMPVTDSKIPKPQIQD